jgi:hypothetical protein
VLRRKRCRQTGAHRLQQQVRVKGVRSAAS